MQNELAGEWELIGDENCNINFLGMNSFSDPGANFGHKFSLNNGRFYNPSRNDKEKKYLPEILSYKFSNDSIYISDYNSISYNLSNDSLFMKYNGCKLIFKKVKEHKKLKDLNILKLIFTVTNEDGVLLDSLSISDSEIHIYKVKDGKRMKVIDTEQYIIEIFKLINNVDVDYLGKSYDEPVDSYKNTFYFIDNKNNVHQIISHGPFRTPYDVKILRRYVYRLYN